MNDSTNFVSRDPEAVRAALGQLLTKKEAQTLFADCEGSAAQLLELARVRGGRAWAKLQAVQRLHEQALMEVASRGPALLSPQSTREFLSRVLATRPYEVFCVLYLDNRHRIIAWAELFRGTIDGASVHPREVVRSALAHNAAAVLLVHNHPSGIAEPSQADELITRRLREALAVMDIRTLDHLIVAGNQSVSFAERGLL